MRVGDCSWLEMPYGHTWGPPGYPRLVAEALARGDTALRFANHQVALAADLPDPATLERTCGEASPDAIIVEIGAYYSTRGLLDGKLVEPYELRTWFHWIAGPVGGFLHRRLSRPVLRRYGHYRSSSACTAHADDDLKAFLIALRAHYPGVPVAFLAPHMTTVDAAVDPARLREAADLLVAAARATLTKVIDVDAELHAAARSGECVFGASGLRLVLRERQVANVGMLARAFAKDPFEGSPSRRLLRLRSIVRLLTWSRTTGLSGRNVVLPIFHTPVTSRDGAKLC